MYQNILPRQALRPYLPYGFDDLHSSLPSVACCWILEPLSGLQLLTVLTLRDYRPDVIKRFLTACGGVYRCREVWVADMNFRPVFRLFKEVALNSDEAGNGRNSPLPLSSEFRATSLNNLNICVLKNIVSGTR